MAKKLSFLPTLRSVLTLIALAIRFRACLDWTKNPALLAHKTILTLTLLKTVKMTNLAKSK